MERKIILWNGNVDEMNTPKNTNKQHVVRNKRQCNNWPGKINNVVKKIQGCQEQLINVVRKKYYMPKYNVVWKKYKVARSQTRTVSYQGFERFCFCGGHRRGRRP